MRVHPSSLRPIERRTARLRLRELTLDDAPHILELCSDPDVIRLTGDEPCRSIEEARAITAFMMSFYDRSGMGRLAVEIGATGDFAGYCGLRPREGQGVELGYRLRARYWGSGYATEAARAMLEFGLDVLGLDRVIGRVDPANAASERVLQSWGCAA